MNAFATELEFIIPTGSPIIPTHIDKSGEKSLRVDKGTALLGVRRRSQSFLELKERSFRVCHTVQWFHLSQDDHAHHGEEPLFLFDDRIETPG